MARKGRLIKNEGEAKVDKQLIRCKTYWTYWITIDILDNYRADLLPLISFGGNCYTMFNLCFRYFDYRFTLYFYLTGLEYNILKFILYIYRSIYIPITHDLSASVNIFPHSSAPACARGCVYLSAKFYNLSYKCQKLWIYGVT